MHAVSGGLGRALADLARPARWGDLRLRVASAVVLGPLALVCVWLGGIAWLVLVGLAGAGACWEWWHMARGRPSAAMVAGMIYTVLAVAALAWLRADPAGGLAALVFLLAIVWSSDVGAYVAGRVFGGPRLAPAISPGKTWSGAAGGLVASMAAGGAVAAAWHGRVGPALLLAAALGVASQLGDLLESAAKRHFGVKDSSRLIPGHGGLLDRLDGLMAAALAAGAWAWTTGQGAAAWR